MRSRSSTAPEFAADSAADLARLDAEERRLLEARRKEIRGDFAARTFYFNFVAERLGAIDAALTGDPYRDVKAEIQARLLGLRRLLSDVAIDFMGEVDRRLVADDPDEVHEDTRAVLAAPAARTASFADDGELPAPAGAPQRRRGELERRLGGARRSQARLRDRVRRMRDPAGPAGLGELAPADARSQPRALSGGRPGARHPLVVRRRHSHAGVRLHLQPAPPQWRSSDRAHRAGAGRAAGRRRAGVQLGGERRRRAHAQGARPLVRLVGRRRALSVGALQRLRLPPPSSGRSPRPICGASPTSTTKANTSPTGASIRTRSRSNAAPPRCCARWSITGW